MLVYVEFKIYAKDVLDPQVRSQNYNIYKFVRLPDFYINLDSRDKFGNSQASLSIYTTETLLNV